FKASFAGCADAKRSFAACVPKRSLGTRVTRVTPVREITSLLGSLPLLLRRFLVIRGDRRRVLGGHDDDHRRLHLRRGFGLVFILFGGGRGRGRLVRGRSRTDGPQRNPDDLSGLQVGSLTRESRYGGVAAAHLDELGLGKLLALALVVVDDRR